MSIVDELKNVRKNSNITVLIRDPGLYEQYIGYFIGNDKKELCKLEKQKRDNDLMPTMKVRDFIQYFKDREELLKISRETKIISMF